MCVPEVFPGCAEGPLLLSAARDGAWAVFEEGVVVLDGLSFFGVCEGLAGWDGEGRVRLWHLFCEGLWAGWDVIFGPGGGKKRKAIMTRLLFYRFLFFRLVLLQDL